MKEFCFQGCITDEHGRETLYFSPGSAFDVLEVFDETEDGIKLHKKWEYEFEKTTLKITIKDKKE